MKKRKENYWCHNLATKWFGAQYAVTVLKIFDVPHKIFVSLLQDCENQRPEHRLTAKYGLKLPLDTKNNKKEVEDYIYQACLMKNASILYSKLDLQKHEGFIVTFEIKPKWLFLNDCPFINKNNVRKHVCRFSMHQYQRHKSNLDKMTQYCPLSLLSNDKKIIQENILHLYKSPQSFLKIFKHGINNNNNIDKNRQNKTNNNDKNLKLIPMDMNDMYQFICENETKLNENESKNNEIKKIFDCIVDILLNNQVKYILYRLSILQRLDILDIECINPMYQRLKQIVFDHDCEKKEKNASNMDKQIEFLLFGDCNTIDKKTKKENENETKDNQDINSSIETTINKCEQLWNKYVKLKSKNDNFTINCQASTDMIGKCWCHDLENGIKRNVFVLNNESKNDEKTKNGYLDVDQMNKWMEKLTKEDMINYIRWYMVSSVFKDCSLMITVDINSLVSLLRAFMF